ncbi:MAG TPA: V-type ATP synthase subunit I [Syntrophorhabdaceae bacterium]|nr:V-type ATP synthase subunit I [Syntrophorhabdaceae bacterium]
MAIEPLKKVTIVNTKEAHRRLIKTINNLGIMEVIDARSILKDDVPFTTPKVDTSSADSNLNKIDFILNLMDTFLPEKENFLKSLTPLPVVTSETELNKILKEYNLDEHYKYAVELDETYRNAERIIAEIETEMEDLRPLMDIDIDLEELYSTKRIKILIGYVPEKKLKAIDEKEEIWQWIAWEKVSPSEGLKEKEDRKDTVIKVKVIFAFLKEYEEEVKKLLSELNFEEITLPKRKEKVKERMAELEEDKENYKNKIAEVKEKVNYLLEDNTPREAKKKLLILKAYWTNVRNRQLALMKGVEGKWVYMVSGYIRAKDTELLKNTIEKEFPQSIITIEDPSPEEDVPVSISVPYLLRPIQLLIEMFGLPYYKNFDPTPFMQINFYLFFGICFSDVCYGIMLTLMGAYLSKKTRLYRGVNNLSRMLFYGGISSIIFGALTGSWFGDLYKPEYLGEGNILYMLQQKFVIIDPMAKTIIALIIALGLGVLNQFFGITLKMYGLYRKRDFIGVISDGLCWIITLTGILIMAGQVFTDLPKSIFNTGIFLFIIGAIGLILTQGREIKGTAGRFAGGLISLYGIVGSYGITAFIGDTLSYCRLLALGLTTSIVAMAFNLMAGMLKGIPYIGIILFIIVLVIGHVFNFLISALGAFVHSMRLIFVEFFGRFYEGGARPFQPLGFDSNLCIIKKEKKAII